VVAREIELPRCEAAVRCGLAEVAELRGDLDGALGHAQEAVRVARANDVLPLLPNTLDAEATVLAALRRFDSALERWHEALALFTPQQRALEIAALQARRAALHLARGDAAAAQRDLDTALALPEATRQLSASVLVCAWQAACGVADARADGLLGALRERLDRLLSQVPAERGRQRLVELPYWRAVARAVHA
jgi:tetratricopeptide (TPR) repeat protein